jgi:hypothetical protein
MLGHLPSGMKGFDCDTAVTEGDAHRFRQAGYRFVLRYVRRTDHHAHDLTPLELAGLLRAGLAVMVVQHVAPEGWHPLGDLGRQYGRTAAEEASAAAVNWGTTLWCDLEGVAHGTDPRDVIAFCNAWYDSVKAGGYEPGLYVGNACGLSAHDLYYRLKFQLYWAAYNLNRDEYPLVRGACMRQHAAIPSDRVPSIHYPFDINLMGVDKLGGMPTLLLPTG